MSTETSHHSYVSRLRDSLKSILIGILLLIGSIRFLAWNENNFIKQKEAYEEGAKNVQEANIDSIDSTLEGQLIHVSGKTHSDDNELIDPELGIKNNNLKLYRDVEMYQRFEDSDTECNDNYGGSEDCTTTYTYHKDWSNDKIDSSYFNEQGHNNPTEWEYETNEREKDPINLGAYTLTTSFTEQLTTKEDLYLSGQDITLNSFNDHRQNAGSGASNSGNLYHVFDSYIYIGEDPSSPNIGDIKIKFSYTPEGTVSVIGKQNGSELGSYTVTNGKKIALLENDTISADEMFTNAQSANQKTTWLYRALGLLLMYFGFCLMFNFLTTLAKVIPFLSSIIGAGTGLVALGLTIITGFLTIGIAWLYARPIIAIVILCCGIGLGYGILRIKKSQKSEIIQPKNDIEQKD